LVLLKARTKNKKILKQQRINHQIQTWLQEKTGVKSKKKKDSKRSKKKEGEWLGGPKRKQKFAW